MSRIIFPSFTGVVSHLVNGTIAQDDLDTGLFFFGCVREHVEHPGKHGEVNEISILTYNRGEEFANQIHQKIWNAVLKAEGEGRIAWHEYGKYSDWPQLIELVNRNGGNYNNDILNILPNYCGAAYCYPYVKMVFEPLGYHVIY